jgi:hypothetical protein
MSNPILMMKSEFCYLCLRHEWSAEDGMESIIDKTVCTKCIHDNGEDIQIVIEEKILLEI